MGQAEYNTLLPPDRPPTLLPEFPWTWMLILLLKPMASSDGGSIDQVIETVH